MVALAWLRATFEKVSDRAKALVRTRKVRLDGYDCDALMNLILVGGWSLHRRIGHGSYGVVHKITNKQGQILAWKTCKLRGDWKRFDDRQRKSHQASLRRFKREYYTMCQMDHPHIVSAVQVGMFVEARNRHSMSYAMEYLPDGDLHDLNSHYHVRGKSFPEIIGFQVFRQMLEALAYLEPLQRCHNDLKPDNILVMKLSADEYVFKLTDFAFSSTTGDRNKYESVARYTAPEVLSERKHNPKSDVFSLWCVILDLMNIDGHADMDFCVATGEYDRGIRHAEDIWVHSLQLWYWRGCGALDVSHRQSASTVLSLMNQLKTPLTYFMNDEIHQIWETDGIPMLSSRLDRQVAADAAHNVPVVDI